MRAALPALEAAPSTTATTRELILMRMRYKQLKDWTIKSDPVRGETRRALEAALRKHGLFSKFSAILITGVSAVDASQPKDDAKGDTKATEEAKAKAEEATTAAVGNIVWQSRHFGEQAGDYGGIEWSLGGRIGMQPALNLVSVPAEAGDASAAPASLVSTHQNAFVWTGGIKLHMPIPGIDGEFGVYGSTGSSTLTTLPKAIGSGSGAVLAVPLSDGVSRTAWRWESGLTFDIFDNALEQIHAEGSTLAPQFQALVAVRRDDRFSGSAFDGYHMPESRFVFRMTLDALRVLDKRQVGDASKTFTFGFVVEHERALSRRGRLIPAATRFLLRGDINLLNAVSGVVGAKDDKNGEAGASTATSGVSHVWTTRVPEPHDFAFKTRPTAVTVTLKKLTSASGEIVTTTPPPQVVVASGASESLAVPACPGGSIRFTLRNSTLRVDTADWGTCGVATVELGVAETAK